ncbi:hypothetical protein [Microcoleus sp. B7-D4]
MSKRKSDRPFASKTQGRSLSDYFVVKTRHQPQPKGMGQRRERLTTF